MRLNNTATIYPKIKSLKIETFKSVTSPNSIHGIYPYRGKMFSVDAAAIIKQLAPGVLLDPFCGSGTILYEANLAGLQTIGIDNNPLAIWIAKGKIASLDNNVNKYTREAENLIKKAKHHKINQQSSPLIKKAFHKKTASEIFSLIKYFNEMSDYTRACFLGAIALAARGCNQYKWTSSTVGKNIEPKQYINFYEKFLNKLRKHIYPIASKNNCKINLYDSRKLRNIIKAKSIDYVFTSPPYFDALDYTAYYGRIVYELLGVDYLKVKKNLIQTATKYEADMKVIFDELIRVTKDDGLIIFVVGDKKTKDKIINGGDFFSKLLKHRPNNIIERSYTGSSSQIFDKLNKTKRREQIVIWDKSTWK